MQHALVVTKHYKAITNELTPLADAMRLVHSHTILHAGNPKSLLYPMREGIL